MKKFNDLYFQLLGLYFDKRISKSIIFELSSLHQSRRGKTKGVVLVPPIDSLNDFAALTKSANIQSLLPLEKYTPLKKKTRLASLLVIEIKDSDCGVAPSEMIERLSAGRRGLDLVEGIWAALFFAKVLKKQAFDLLNAKYSIECIPTLYEWRRQVFLSAICPDVQDSKCGAPIVVKELLLKEDDFTKPDIMMRKIRILSGANFKM